MKVPKSLRNSASLDHAIPEEQFHYQIPASLLRLSVVTQFFPPDYAATGQLIEELVEQLGRQGVDIKVFTGQPNYAFKTTTAPAYEQHGLIQIKRSRATQLWSKRIRGKAIGGILFMIRTALHLIKNCRRRNLILITTAPPFLPLLGYLANAILRFPYVCILYDLYPDIAVKLGVVSKQHWIVKFWQFINRQVWRSAKGLIVLSPAMKQRIIELCPEVADKVFVIHSWADPKQITPMPKQDNWFAQQYGLTNKFTVLYSGNMGRCHDMDTIFEAAVQLQDEPIQFVFIGSGAKQDILKERVNRLGLNNMMFLPYQDKDVLPYSLTAGDLSLVSVSPGMENLVAPSKLYSALASGRPIAAICPKHSYLRQLILDANCGDTFSNGDSQGLANFIRQLSHDRQQTERMGAASRRCLEDNFTPEIIARQYNDVLHWAIESETPLVPSSAVTQ